MDRWTVCWGWFFAFLGSTEPGKALFGADWPAVLPDPWGIFLYGLALLLGAHTLSTRVLFGISKDLRLTILTLLLALGWVAARAADL